MIVNTFELFGRLGVKLPFGKKVFKRMREGLAVFLDCYLKCGSALLFDDWVLVIGRPTQAVFETVEHSENRNFQRRLHSENGPALALADGSKMQPLCWCLNFSVSSISQALMTKMRKLT